MPHIAHGKEYDSINRCRRHSKTNIKETGTLFQTEQVGQRNPDKEGSSDALEHYGQRHAMAVKITDVAEYQAGKDGFKAVALQIFYESMKKSL